VRRRPTAKTGTPAAEVREALDAFRLIVQALRVGAREGERRAGLSSAQLFALQRIAENPQASINDLAALTFTHQSSVSVVIQRLVGRRLVAKVAAADDRRRQLLEVTAKGSRALQRAPEAMQQRLIASVAALPAADRRALARSLRAIAVTIAPATLAAHPPMLFEEAQGPQRRQNTQRKPRTQRKRRTQRP
jgi:DNA-binding MarR family transcriptional regulator